MRSNSATLLSLAFSLLLVACGDKEEKVSIMGDRISILSYERTLSVDPRVRDQEFVLPPAFDNTDWSQPGGFPSHAAYHLALGEDLKRLFRVDLVEGSSKYARIMSPPIVAEGKVFAMGAELDVAAVDASTGRVMWRQSVAPEWTVRNPGITRFIGLSRSKLDPEDGFMGGIAYGEGRLFVATGFGEIIALSAGTGEVLWRVHNEIPFSNAPTVRNGQIYVVSQDSRLQVFSTEDGKRRWEHMAITETAGILSASSPAVNDQIVVAGFNSGEIVALRTFNGSVNWSDSLSARALQVTPMSELVAIVGRPVIDRDRVFAVSHGGRMMAVDIRTGERVWTADVGSIETPWVTGDSVVVITTDAEIVSLTRSLGRVRWVNQLPQFEDEEDREGRISWAGPVLGGGRLILASSHGDLYFLSPDNGGIISTMDVDAPVSVTPVIANQTLYILTDEGELIAYR